MNEQRLILPASAYERPPPPVEIVGQYLTHEQIFGKASSAAELMRRLSELRRSDVVGLLCSAMAAVGTTTEAATQLQLVRDMLDPETATLISQKVKGMSRWAVFHRRQLWLLLQLTTIASSEETPAEQGPAFAHKVGQACLMTSDLLSRAESFSATPPDSTSEHLKWLISILVSHTESPLANEAIARGWTFWLESLADPDVRREFEKLNIGRDFEDVFARHYGISLREFLLITVGFYFHFLSSTLKRPVAANLIDASVPSDGLFSDADKSTALSLLARRIDEMPPFLLGAPRQSWAMDYAPLMAKPLLEVLESKYACPDLSHLLAFFVDGIYWLLNEAANNADWKKFFGSIYESYCNRLIGSFTVASESLVTTFYRSPKFRGTEDQVCDGLILWPSIAVLCEYKSSRFNSRQRSGVQMDETVAAIESSVGSDKKGIGQLSKTISRILSGEKINARNSNVDIGTNQVLVPVVIWYEESAGNHAVRNFLQEGLTRRLKELRVDLSRVKPLVLFTTHDFEVFERLTHQIGAEQLMGDYVKFLERFPRDPTSMFHVYAYQKYSGRPWPPGLITEKLHQVLREVEAEFHRRKPEDEKEG